MAIINTSIRGRDEGKDLQSVETPCCDKKPQVGLLLTNKALDQHLHLHLQAPQDEGAFLQHKPYLSAHLALFVPVLHSLALPPTTKPAPEFEAGSQNFASVQEDLSLKFFLESSNSPFGIMCRCGG